MTAVLEERRTAASSAWRLGLILLLALAVRLIWAALIPVEPVSDANAYDTFARNIALHGVYGWTPEQPGAFWAVGTAAIYGAGYWLFGVDYAVVVTFNLVTSLATIWLLYHLGRVYFGALAGQIAGLAFALWPVTIQFVTTLSSELFFMAFTLGGLVCWERAIRDRRWTWFLAAGALLAAAVYVRPIALLLPPILAMAGLLRGQMRLAQAVTAMIVTLAVMAMLIAPWTYRNYLTFDKPVLISTNFGVNFWMGNNPDSRGEYTPFGEHVVGLSETERSEVLLEKAKAYIRAEPGAFVQRTLIKALRLHDRETIGVAWNEKALHRLGGDTGVFVAKFISTLYWYLMLCAGLAGAVWLCRRESLWKGLLAPPVIIWGYVTGVHAVIVISDRYHMPSIPFIALLGAGMTAAWLSGRKRT